jgi:hypothetical protein
LRQCGGEATTRRAGAREGGGVEGGGGFDAADRVGEEDLIGGEEVLVMQGPLVGLDSQLRSELEDCGPDDAGKDAAVGRGCSQGSFDDGEEVRPARLEQLDAVGDQRPWALRRAFEIVPVYPLVRAEAAWALAGLQSGSVLRKDGPRPDPTCKQVVPGAVFPRDDRETEAPEGGPVGGGEQFRADPCREVSLVDGLQAPSQARQMFLQLDRLPVHHEQRLEHAKARIRRAAGGRHRDILPARPPRC